MRCHLIHLYNSLRGGKMIDLDNMREILRIIEILGKCPKFSKAHHQLCCEQIEFLINKWHELYIAEELQIIDLENDNEIINVVCILDYCHR